MRLKFLVFTTISANEKIVDLLKLKRCFVIGQNSSGIPEAETFGRNRKFSAFGFRFRPPKLKAEYGRNSRKALDFFFPSVCQDEV